MPKFDDIGYNNRLVKNTSSIAKGRADNFDSLIFDGRLRDTTNSIFSIPGAYNEIQFNRAGRLTGADFQYLESGATTRSFALPNQTSANTDGFNFIIQGSKGRGTGAGGYVAINSGEGGSSVGEGGRIELNAGQANAGNSNGGSILLTPGLKNGGGVNGDIIFVDPTTTFQAVFKTSTLASSRNFTFPDASGTFLLDTDGNLSGGTVTATNDFSANGTLGISTVATVIDRNAGVGTITHTFTFTQGLLTAYGTA